MASSAIAQDDDEDDDGDDDSDDDDDDDDGGSPDDSGGGSGDGSGGSGGGGSSGGGSNDRDDDDSGNNGSSSGRSNRSYPEGFLSQRDVQRAIRNGDAMSLNSALSRLRDRSSGTPIDTHIFSTGSRLVYVFTVRESNGNVSRLGLDARSGNAVRIR